MDIIHAIIEEIGVNKQEELEELVSTVIKCFEYDILEFFINDIKVDGYSEIGSFCVKESLKYHNYYKLKDDVLPFDDDIMEILVKNDYYFIINDIINNKIINLENLLESALRFSCYDVIKLIKKVLDFKVDEREIKKIEKIKEKINYAKSLSDSIEKFSYFDEIYFSGLNTEIKYIELYKDEKIDVKSDDDEYLKFISLKNSDKSFYEIIDEFERPDDEEFIDEVNT